MTLVFPMSVGGTESIQATVIPHIARRRNGLARLHSITNEILGTQAIGHLLDVVILTDGILSAISTATRSSWNTEVRQIPLESTSA